MTGPATELQPRRAAQIRLEPGTTLGQAIRVIIASCLAHFRANLDGVLVSDDSEFVHQARVALRRMRSAFRYAQGAAPPLEALQPEVRWLAARLGTARDWDVLVEETLPGLVKVHPEPQEAERILALARKRRSLVRGMARRAVASERCRALLDRLDQWLAAEEAFPAPPVTDEAARIIGNHFSKLLRRGACLADQTPERRHRVRITAKRLRYAMQHFRSLDESGLEEALEDVATVQDELGALNDAATTAKLLARLPSAEAFSVFVCERLRAREEAHLDKAQAAIDRLDKRKPVRGVPTARVE